MHLLITTQIVSVEDPVLGFFHRWILEFAQHFERIDVICLKAGTYHLPANVFVHSLGKEHGESRVKYIFRFYAYFTKLFFSYRITYVFFHMGAIYNILALPFFLIRKLRGTQFFWWKTHGKVDALKERIALSLVDRVCTAGSKSFDVKSEKVVVVGHAIDTDRFSMQRDARHTPGACLMVGRIVPVKKIEVVLRALTQIGEARGITLTLIGSPDKREYQEELEKYAKTHSLTRVQFLGSRKQSELQAYYDEAGILLHPAYEAGLDKAVLEAMATGVIPLTSIPSYEPMIGQYGLFIQKEDDRGYRDALVRITEMSPEELSSLRTILRAIVVENHSITTLPQRIFGV
jgi:glycosyltransferase involved in cell wall biosynthesis